MVELWMMNPYLLLYKDIDSLGTIGKNKTIEIPPYVFLKSEDVQ